MSSTIIACHENENTFQRAWLGHRANIVKFNIYRQRVDVDSAAWPTHITKPSIFGSDRSSRSDDDDDIQSSSFWLKIVKWS